jgi:hypothetical protein
MATLRSEKASVYNYVWAEKIVISSQDLTRYRLDSKGPPICILNGELPQLLEDVQYHWQCDKPCTLSTLIPGYNAGFGGGALIRVIRQQRYNR